MDLAARFGEHACAGDLLPPRARVLVAVSGGGDSVALLHLLAGIARERPLALEVASLDHRTRPGTADEVRFVGALCAALGVPFHPLALAAPPETPGEEAMRRARREALGAAAAACGATRVALGHQADDVAETMVMRLLRGAGLDGLAGIPGRVGGVVRPLLPFERRELRAWLRGRGLAWVEDPSNADERRLRARVRHRVLPALRAKAPDVAGALRAAAGAVAGLLGPLDRWEAAWLAAHAERGPDGLRCGLAELRAEPPAVRGRLVRRAAESLGVPRSRLGRACVAEVLAAAARDAAGGAVPLPGGLEAVREPRVLRLGPRELAPERHPV